MPKNMRAIVIERFGGPDELKLRKLPVPKPGPREVLIAVSYAGVNPVDWKIREGLLQSALPHQFPLIPGWDATGEIAEVGSEITKFEPGQMVYAYCRKPLVQWGAYAQYIAVAAEAVSLLPRGVAMVEAAGIPLAGLTAWQALNDYVKLDRQSRVLIHAGAGGVGGFAIQFAKILGANVTTTVSREKHDYVRQFGADHLIDYRAEDFVVAGRKISPEGFDLVFDTVGGETLERSWELVKKGGLLVSIVDTPDAARAERQGIRALYHFVYPHGGQLHEISELVDAKRVRAPHVEILPLEKAAQAQQKSQSGRTVGKIVLQV